MLHLGLGYQAFFAIVLGIFTGLFFGPLCTSLKPVGDAFVMLLQMVVLPYIPTLIIHGVGSLSPETAKKLFKRGWFFLILLWLIMFGTIYVLKGLIPTPLPDPSADLSNKTLAFSQDFLAYIIPQNPFYDLANNIVPAIAFLSMIIGVAIMHLREKEPLLSFVGKANEALEKIFKWIALISPFGIFAHIAHVTGTVQFEDLAKLELYVVAFILSALFLSLWVLPTLVSCLTSIPYKELMREYRIVCLLAFATGIPSIAFPFMNNCMRRLAEKKNLELGTFRNTSQTVIPLSYSFAQIGNFFLLFFVFFISFFYRHPLKQFENIILPFLTIPISFGTPQLSLAGMDFLINALSFPRDAFSLFVETMSITLNFQVLLSVSSMLSLTILVILRYYGLLQVQWKRLGMQVSAMVFSLLVCTLIAKHFVHINDNYRNLYYNLKMSDVISDPPPVTVYQKMPDIPPPDTTEVLSRVLKTGVLRVGYDTGGIPFCYLNNEGQIVGYDMAFAYQLAKDLDVRLELIPVDYYTFLDDMKKGLFDIVMCAILIDEERLIAMDFCHAYSEEANALVVPVDKAPLYQDLSKISKDPSFKIGGVGGYKNVIRRHFLPEQLAPVDSMEDLMQGKVSAQMWSEIPAYIWCLAHPAFTSLTYQKSLGMKYFGYPVKSGSIDMVVFVDQWLGLKEQMGFTKLQKDYWIHGKKPPSADQRWCIAKDVLHWF